MRCCGDKRARLAHVQGSRTSPTDASSSTESTARERKERTFEYVGDKGLTVRGAVSGKMYRFEARGDLIEVAHDDAFAMMAERDVRLT